MLIFYRSCSCLWRDGRGTGEAAADRAGILYGFAGTFNHKGGKFTDVSRSVVPQYNKEKFVYELPRNGTTVEVFAKDESGEWNKGTKCMILFGRRECLG